MAWCGLLRGPFVPLFLLLGVGLSSLSSHCVHVSFLFVLLNTILYFALHNTKYVLAIHSLFDFPLSIIDGIW